MWKRKQLPTALLLALLFSCCCCVAHGQELEDQNNGRPLTYQITQEQLNLWNKELQQQRALLGQLELSRQKSAQELATAREQLAKSVQTCEALRLQLLTLQAKSNANEKLLQSAQQALTVANESLQQYRLQEQRKRRRIKAQRNGGYTIAAIAIIKAVMPRR